MGYIAAFVLAGLLGLVPAPIDLCSEPKNKKAKRRAKIIGAIAGAFALVAGIMQWRESQKDTAKTQA
jgi:hypothetical protein